MTAASAEPLVRVDGLTKHFPVSGGRLLRGREVVHALDGVTLDVRRGETLGVVGETGCGKSTFARCVSRLHSVTAGSVVFDGHDITRLSRRQLRPFRLEMQMIFQDPYGSLNPRRRVGSIIGDPFAIQGAQDDAPVRKRRVQELMEVVGLNPEHYNRFPAEFSGGQRQRIGVARALALRPKLIICDEPVSALDVSIQAQIINLLAELQRDFGLTYVFIAHDLSVVRHVSDRIAVMYLGKVAEVAETEELFARPRHPYTNALLSAIPEVDRTANGDARRGRILLGGDVPSPISPPTGCRFHPRCPKAQERCAADDPLLAIESGSHAVACHYPVQAGELARPPHDSPTDVAAARAPEPDASSGSERAEAAQGLAFRSIRGRSPWELAWQRLRRDRVAVGSATVILLMALFAILAPAIAHLLGHGPSAQYLDIGLTKEGLPRGPTGNFLFGTDDLGRDVFVRVAYGARVSLLAGVVASFLAVTTGVVIGLTAGYFGGATDTFLARFIDVILSFPFLLFAIALVSIVGPSLTVAIAIIVFFSWAPVGRIVRGQTLSLKEREYVDAARSLGASDLRIMFVDIFPNLLAPVLVYLTLLIPASIAFEATLSFLGLGVVPPTASWGNMLSESLGYYRVAWWFVICPAGFLLITTLAFNLLGDSVRDALDPRGQRLFRR